MSQIPDLYLGMIYTAAAFLALALIFFLGYREYDRNMDRLFILDAKTNKPEWGYCRFGNGTFDYKRRDGSPLKIDIPDGLRPLDLHARGGLLIVDEKGHCLEHVSKDGQGRNARGPALRPYDAAHYYWLGDSKVFEKSVRSYDETPFKINPKILLGVLMFFVIAAAVTIYIMYGQV